MTLAVAAAAGRSVHGVRRDAPLSVARLWHSARTSQREAVRQCLTPDPMILFAFLLGGNRAGKSDAGAQMDVALGLGSAHPWTRSWLNLNRLPLYCIPPEPHTVWCVSGDSNDSIRYVRPKLAKYLGPSAQWKNREGQGEAKATIETEHGTATWWFKSVDQGRDGFQGDAPRAIGFDEEPLDWEVVEECIMRVVDEAGRLHFRMTPLYGWTRLMHERVREVRPDTVVCRISGEDNPHLDQFALARSLAATSESLRRARAFGEITTTEGLVYQLDRERHVVKAFEPPKDWPRYLSIDFGTRNPACWLFGAVDPKDDVLHFHREHHRAGLTLAQHVREVTGFDPTDPSQLPALREWFGQFSGAVADPEDLDARMQLEEWGLETTPANKAIRHGIDVVTTRMNTGGVRYHDSCPNLIREKEGYRWPKAKAGAVNDGTETPVKKDDHAVDAERYLCVYLDDNASTGPLAIGGATAPSYWR